MLPLITMRSGLLGIERSIVISCSVSLQIIMARIQIQMENRKCMGWICKEKSMFCNNIDSTSCYLCLTRRTLKEIIFKKKSVRSVACTLLLLIQAVFQNVLESHNVLLSIQKTGRSLSIQYLQGFPWRSVVKTPHFHCRGLRFSP